MNRKKRTLVVGALLAAATSAATVAIAAGTAAAASTTTTVRTSSGPLNVRSGPSTQFPATSQLRSGASVTLACQSAGEWIHGAVRATTQWDRMTNGRWVSHAYVQSNAALVSCAALDAPPASSSGSGGSGVSVRTDGGSLNVRSAPSTGANLVTTVANGAPLSLDCSVTGEAINGTVRSSAQWDKLTSGGYVSHAYVNTNGTVPQCDTPAPAPVVPASPATTPTPVAPAPSTPVASTPAASPSPSANAYTEGGPLNVRSAPTSSSALVTTVDDGAALNLTCAVDGESISGAVRSSAQWDKLASGGYVSHAYVQTTMTLPACAAASTPATPTTFSGLVKTEGGPLNVRSAPSTSASAVGQVPNGGTVTLSCAASGSTVSGAVRTTNQWDRLDNGNYVSHAYISTAANLPTCTGAAPVTGTTGPVGSMTNAQFIAAAVPAAQQGYREFKVPASVTIAQAILESGWGKSALTQNDRNYFGIKCFNGSPGPIANGCHSYATYECTPTCYATYASFRTYASITDSFRDHGSFLTTNSRYAPAFAYSGDPNQFLYQIWKAGYATSPTYVANVESLMQQYNLYQYDLQ